MFREFKQNLSESQEKETKTVQQNYQRTGICEDFVFSSEHYSITPPHHYGHGGDFEAKITKYKNLCVKGYIEDIDSLALPYIMERQANGKILSPEEQVILAKYQDAVLPDAYTKAMVMLKTIGLIEGTKNFPKKGSDALYVLGIDYGLLPEKDISSLYKV